MVTRLDGCKQAPFTWDAFERVRASRFKMQARPCYQVLYRARNQYFTGLRERTNTRSNVHCDATELATRHFTLTRVDTRPYPDTQVLNRIYSRPGASNRPSRAIESSQETITGSIDLATTMTFKLLAYSVVVMTKKLFPSTVTNFRRKLGGADDIREEDSGEYAIGVRPTAHAG
jgi:hypothetical protein